MRFALLNGLMLTLAFILSACAPAKRSYDYGMINVGGGGTFTVSSYGATEREAEKNAFTAARLYCQENKRGLNVELSEGKMAYRGPFDNAGQHKAVTGLMTSIGEGFKVKSGWPIGPSASVKIDPKETADKLSEDSFQASFTVVCHP